MIVAFIKNKSGHCVGTIDAADNGKYHIVWRDRSETTTQGNTHRYDPTKHEEYELAVKAVDKHGLNHKEIYTVIKSNEYELFEQAKKLYGYHSALYQLDRPNPEYLLDPKIQNAIKWLKNEYTKAAKEIYNLGGSIAEGTNNFGEKGPVAKNQIDTPIKYEIGESVRLQFLHSFRDIF